MRFRNILPLLAVSLVGTACDDEPVVAPDVGAPEVVAPSFSVRHGAVTQSVTGLGLYTDGDAKRTFSFSAVKYADGRVRGEWEGFNRSVEPRDPSHGEVVCFTIEGNEAWIGGRIEKTFRGSEGREFGWRVIDNGQGANSPPDQITRTLRARTALDFCSGAPAIGFMHSLEAGNIRVRP